ncbi:MAG: hypothetical protein HY706_18400 [Candidatus Hydrogenedentes bacterium]|nr:hypothetical protein [Candidatus Hydrogenedentota bacterium]
MKKTKGISRKLYIEELERPAVAVCKSQLVTEALGEFGTGGTDTSAQDGLVTTLAIGEECIKSK